MVKKFMRELKPNLFPQEIPGERHSGKPLPVGKAQSPKEDKSAQKRALKLRQKAQGHV
jgi:hypothetical protein